MIEYDIQDLKERINELEEYNQNLKERMRQLEAYLFKDHVKDISFHIDVRPKKKTNSEFVLKIKYKDQEFTFSRRMNSSLYFDREYFEETIDFKFIEDKIISIIEIFSHSSRFYIKEIKNQNPQELVDILTSQFNEILGN